MALTIKYDDEFRDEWRNNHEALVQSIADLSENVAKWQGKQTEVIKTGFTDLIRVLGGNGDEQIQILVNQLATNLNLSSDEVERAMKQSQPKKGDNDNGG